ncbi:hypothetical protein LCGC14_1432670 [marine sediment metagenome]|uniref:Uncharacterized protein n=1 Tax=marine sediment metagenome TaxID=412755 RepID=A0A0F9MPX6_9ZZZZ
MGFFGVDVYVHLGMLFTRLLDLAEDGHTVKIEGTIITVGDRTIGFDGSPLTLDCIERAIRSVTPKVSG